MYFSDGKSASVLQWMGSMERFWHTRSATNTDRIALVKKDVSLICTIFIRSLIQLNAQKIPGASI